jgi:hypothetical protein
LIIAPSPFATFDVDKTQCVHDALVPYFLLSLFALRRPGIGDPHHSFGVCPETIEKTKQFCTCRGWVRCRPHVSRCQRLG